MSFANTFLHMHGCLSTYLFSRGTVGNYSFTGQFDKGIS